MINTYPSPCPVPQAPTLTKEELLMPVQKGIERVPAGPGAVEIPCCRFPDTDPETLRNAILSAPHLAALWPYAAPAGNDRLRLILFTEDLPTAWQAATALAACHAEPEKKEAETYYRDELDGMDELDKFLGLYSDDDDTASDTFDAARNLMLANAEGIGDEADEEENAMMKMGMINRQAMLLSAWENASSILFHADGELLTDTLLGYLERNNASYRNVFLVVKRYQFHHDRMLRLCFDLRFRVCRLGTVSADYQEKVFRAVAAQKQITFDRGADLRLAVARLKRMRGRMFSQSDFAVLLDHAVLNKGNRKLLKTDDLIFRDESRPERSAREELNALVGLSEVKRTIREIAAEELLEIRRCEAGYPNSERHHNYAFTGEPGTCKSVTARLFARTLQETGVSSGSFVEVGREQLIGRYLGQTSPLVAAAFKKAEGGVLFVDEAGAFLAGGTDSYSQEAIDAFVRHMENHPETTVIFASYPDQIDELLGSNPGIASRISRVLRFPSYTDEELCDILRYLAAKQSYELPEGWEQPAAGFFADLRGKQKDRFGNGREARRLLEESIRRMAVRIEGQPDAALNRLAPEDIRGAADELLSGTRRERVRIGF